MIPKPLLHHLLGTKLALAPRGQALQVLPLKRWMQSGTVMWLHSWDDVPDRSSRCWICGGKDHRKNECKLRPAGKKQGDPSSGSGEGRGGKAGAAAVSKPTTRPGIKEMNTQNSGDGKGVALAPEVAGSTTAAMDGKDGDGRGRGDDQVKQPVQERQDHRTSS